MKCILFFCCLLLIGVNITAQQDHANINLNSYDIAVTGLTPGKISMKNMFVNGPAKDYDYYKRKSRNNRITGLSLLGAGLLLGGAGILVSSNSGDYGTDFARADRNDRTVGVLFVCSAITGIASIPFMIISWASGSKAKRIGLKGQKSYFKIPGKAGKDMTGLALSIPIGS